MGLLQEILDKIETDAAADSAMAMQCAGLIAEAEALRDTLHHHGLAEARPVFINQATNGDIVFFLSHTRHSPSEVRQALAAADISIAAEVPKGQSVELQLTGLDCRIWIAAEQALALAA